MRYLPILLLASLALSCSSPQEPSSVTRIDADSIKTASSTLPSLPVDSAGATTSINTGNTTPDELLAYARSLTGVPYKYGSTDPSVGFDCSGFITYVFNHFNIQVPRTSGDFTFVQQQIDIKQAKTGDLVLFTGTDSTIREVGHMGILIAEPGQELTFIHSTSGHDKGVVETPMNSYYQGRYMKTIRIFPQNDDKQ